MKGGAAQPMSENLSPPRKMGYFHFLKKPIKLVREVSILLIL
jgi:hypothetical protein